MGYHSIEFITLECVPGQAILEDSVIQLLARKPEVCMIAPRYVDCCRLLYLISSPTKKLTVHQLIIHGITFPKTSSGPAKVGALSAPRMLYRR